MAMGPTDLLPTQDRRQHPRRPCALAVTIVSPDRAEVLCESIDVSLGGIAVKGRDRMPDGHVLVMLDDALAISGQIVEEVIDADSGLVTARIAFVSTPLAARARLETLTAAPRERSRRRVAAVFAVGAVAVTALVASFLATGDDTVETRGSLAAPSVSTTVAPAPTTSAASSTTVAARPTPTTVPAPAAAAPVPPAPTPAPAMTTTSEPADNALRIIVSEDPDDTAVASTVVPSPGVDRVRIDLGVTPKAEEAGYPVEVNLHNRWDRAISFGDGLLVELVVSRDGVAVREVELRSDVTELEPGASVAVAGWLDLDEPGTYDVTVSVEVTAPSEG